MNLNDRIRITKDALLGQAVGDAFGVPVEFLSRKDVRLIDLHDMVGSDSKPAFISRWGNTVPKGCWSDDTSMTVASMASFINNHGEIDYEDQLQQFICWWDDEEYCSFDYPFGLGGNIAAALKRFRTGLRPLECGGMQIRDNGNGALMRILPFSLYCIFHQLSLDETAEIAGNGSAITHRHDISKLCCFIWTEFLRSVSEFADTEKAIDHIENIAYQQWFSDEAIEAVEFITGGKTRELTENDIGQTGYVVDTLYSALYSLYYAKTFEDAILKAINLGYDTDTVGAVTGMAAGIMYGTENIPARWIECLSRRDYLEDMANQFAKCFPHT